MKSNNGDYFDEYLKNPAYIAMGGGVFLLIVVLFCFIVWNATHDGNNDLVVNNQTENSVELPSMGESVEDVVELPPEPVATPEPDVEKESIEELLAEGSNDQGVVFTEVEDFVTAVEVTNLRSEPSTAQGVNTVVAKLRNGVNVRRVGINEEVGWSKVIYNDQVLYASTAYLLVVEEESE
ncbi:MAG: hypothetical protein IJN16_05365 [Lachnospiraceae bacterium]|nr:hypothetical protein [Lachnospiraceae bacterium]